MEYFKKEFKELFMTQQGTHLLKEALELSAQERAELAEKILSSLELPQHQIEQLWMQESEDRLENLFQNKTKTVSVQEVFHKIFKK